jgi:hypothetical protein
VYFKARTLVLTGFLCAAPVALHAQFDFTVDGRDVQIHSFASQGFMYTNQNNYMTMNTTSGSFAFTDFGANFSTKLTDNFRVGAQIYDRNIGQLGNWHPDLDWAVADYKFKDWLGIRAGKVKTTLGLFNDTQDMEFLQTWALMPQSTYSLDQRGSMISHVGGDIYGNIALKRLGGLSYTVYGGERPDDPYGGYVYALETSNKKGTDPNGIPIVIASTASNARNIYSYSGPVFGSDLRWNTPLKGLLAGASYVDQDPTTKGSYIATKIPFLVKTDKDITTAFYAEYTLGGFRFDGEYRRQINDTTSTNSSGAESAPTDKDIRSGYLAASYRLTKMLEVGTYYSRFYYNWAYFHSDPLNHVFDQAVTVRLDLRSYLDLKIEGHFMNGTMPSATISRGFYVADNPNGLKPDTRLLVIRLGYHL